mmetsp:Transcript_20817/g.31408  ORF Transcript_20817/g.31408 Transcript_20817/m.31408 type:complete len:124 (+) Transcript_20817:669-1040(+)
MGCRSRGNVRRREKAIDHSSSASLRLSWCSKTSYTSKCDTTIRHYSGLIEWISNSSVRTLTGVNDHLVVYQLKHYDLGLSSPSFFDSVTGAGALDLAISLNNILHSASNFCLSLFFISALAAK